jgi:hypothetical protein
VAIASILVVCPRFSDQDARRREETHFAPRTLTSFSGNLLDFDEPPTSLNASPSEVRALVQPSVPDDRRPDDFSTAGAGGGSGRGWSRWTRYATRRAYLYVRSGVGAVVDAMLAAIEC